jgi:hypothetical protein
VPDDPVAPAAVLHIELVFSERAGVTETRQLQLADGATLHDALKASALPAGLWAGAVGVWGRAQPLDTRLRDLDRVEIYRGLQVDPKEARRLRYRQQKKARR